MKKFNGSKIESEEIKRSCGRIGLSRQIFNLEIAGSNPVRSTKTKTAMCMSSSGLELRHCPRNVMFIEDTKVHIFSSTAIAYAHCYLLFCKYLSFAMTLF